MTKKKNDLNLTYIVVAIILGVFLLGYGYIDYRYKMDSLEYKRESDKSEYQQEIQQERVRQSNIQSCLEEINTRVRNFDRSSVTTVDGAKQIIAVWEQQKADCYKKYPAK